MNNVCLPKSITTYYTVNQLVGKNLLPDRTAFIGRCGDGPTDSLYLVTYSGIVLANDPGRTWTYHDCDVTAKHFVDVEIKVL